MDKSWLRLWSAETDWTACHSSGQRSSAYLHRIFYLESNYLTLSAFFISSLRYHFRNLFCTNFVEILELGVSEHGIAFYASKTNRLITLPNPLFTTSLYTTKTNEQTNWSTTFYSNTTTLTYRNSQKHNATLLNSTHSFLLIKCYTIN